MQLLNLGFAILCAKIASCVLPGVLGVWMINGSDESKRGLWRWISSAAFGDARPFRFSAFKRFLTVLGAVLVGFSIIACGLFLWTQAF